MKLNREGSFKHYEGKERIQMGLDLDNTHSIMSLLRNNIYSDPIKSWVREIYSNAVDAHARVNNTSDAIDVEIKTQDGDYIFIVRDYGPSMNKDIIANVYAKMGKSDKRQGNTEMGGWGLGAKSPLAYTDHFWIETWTEEEGSNIYRKWVQYIDASRVGALSLLEESTWTEGKTGTKVSIPFDQKDLPLVTEALQFYLAYTNVKYNFNCTLTEVKINTDRKWYNYFGSNWAMNIYEEEYSYWLNKKNSGLAIVGNIPYQLDCKTLFGYFNHNINDLAYIAENQRPSYINTQDYNHTLFSAFLVVLQYYEFEISLPIGSVDLNASREDLQYTDKTCSYMFDIFYKMFLELYQFVRIDLVEHPNFPEACISYENNYPSGFKKYFLHEVKWSRENIKFSHNPPLFKGSPSKNYNSYKLDTMFVGNTTKKKDVLRRGYNTTLVTGSTQYEIILQDTDYTNFSKFVKYYAQKKNVADKYSIDYLCVDPLDYDKVYDWIKQTLPCVKLSTLVEDFKDNAPASTVNKAAKGTFKTLKYYGTDIRTRADGIGRYFDYDEKYIEPDEEHYYISWDEWHDLPDFFVKEASYNQMNTSLRSYLATKGIDKGNLVLTKKVTRNFNHENWINLVDVLKDDFSKYKHLRKDIALALVTTSLVERQLPLFKEYTEDEIERKDSIYLYLQNLYKSKDVFLKENNNALFFFNLVNPMIRNLRRSRDSTYINVKDLASLKFMGDIQTDAFSIVTEFLEYIDQIPLLKFHDNYRVRDYFIGRDGWTEYINLLEREKNLYTKTSQEPKELEMSEYGKLNLKLTSKYS